MYSINYIQCELLVQFSEEIVPVYVFTYCLYVEYCAWLVAYIVAMCCVSLVSVLNVRVLCVGD